MVEEILLSFCVPSYNRAETTKKTVESILKYNGNDIEVVVVDNCSTDNTIEQLKSIDDNRVKIVVNKKNIGAMGNYIESLKHEQGKYIFVVLSRDTLKADRIPELLDYLKRNDIALMYCGEDKCDRAHEVYGAGTEALYRFAYRCFHQTGFVLQRKPTQAFVNDINPENAYERFGYLPHDFIAARLALYGNCVFYNSIIRNRVDEEYMKTHKSACKEPDHDLWFFPKERILQFEKYVSDLNTLDIDKKTYSKIFMKVYWRQLFSATIGYKENRASEFYCLHYGIPTCEVTNAQMFAIYKRMKQSLNVCRKNKTLNIEAKIFIKLSDVWLIVCNIRRKLQMRRSRLR